jgi:hypothetical protein
MCKELNLAASVAYCYGSELGSGWFGVIFVVIHFGSFVAKCLLYNKGTGLSILCYIFLDVPSARRFNLALEVDGIDSSITEETIGIDADFVVVSGTLEFLIEESGQVFKGFEFFFHVV